MTNEQRRHPPSARVRGHGQQRTRVGGNRDLLARADPTHPSPSRRDGLRHLDSHHLDRQLRVSARHRNLSRSRKYVAEHVALPWLLDLHGHTRRIVPAVVALTALDAGISIPAIAPLALLRGLQRFSLV